MAIGTAFQQALGLRWSAEGDAVTVELDLTDGLLGPARSLEGGVVSTLADVAGASAAARALGPLVATENLSISFLAPGRVGPVRATATVVRSGNGGAVSDVRIVDVGREGRLMAIAQVSVRALAPRPAVSAAGPPVRP